MDAADESTEGYAKAMEEAIASATKAEDDLDVALARVAELEARITDLEGAEDYRSYCEVCDKHFHRNYVTWFDEPFEIEGRHGVHHSACGGCFEYVPIDQGGV